jgi:ParB-like chromosome segregation protein Spo0J
MTTDLTRSNSLADLRVLDTSKYQLMPDMSPAEFEALKADIAQRGVVVPIDIDDTGEILDGHHRYRAWIELKKNDPPPTIVREGLSEQEKRTFARKNNILRRHLTREQVRRLIAEQLKDSPDWADNRIAKELGVDGKTVGTVRNDLEVTSEIPKLDRLLGRDGKARPRNQPRKCQEPLEEDTHEEDEELAELRGTKQSSQAFTRALRAWAEELGQLGDVNDVPDEVKLQMFAAGLTGKDMVVIKGPSPTDQAWGCVKEEMPEQMAIYERAANHLAGPGGMLELEKTDPERAEGIASHMDWMVRNGWTVEAWLGEEGERARARWGYKTLTRKQQKARHAMLRKMIDNGVFGSPALDGRCHEW